MPLSVPASTSPAPGQRNLAALKKYVASYIQQPDDAEVLDLAQLAVNNGIDMVNSFDWLWSVRYQDITVVEGQADYELSSTFSKPRKLSKINASGNIYGDIGFLDEKTFADTVGRDLSSGDPTYYTVFNEYRLNTITLNKKPTSGFTTQFPYLRLRYYSRVPHLQGNAQILDAPPEVWSLVAWYARFDLAAVRGETASADRAERQYAFRLNALRAKDRDVVTDWGSAL